MDRYILRLLLGIAVVLIPLALTACMKMTVKQADREILLRVTDFAEYGADLQNPTRFETFEKLRYFDGSIELKYEFNAPESESHTNVTYLQVTATLERSLRDARMSQGAEAFGTRIGFKYAKISLEEKKDFLPFGEQSAFYVLIKDGQPIGNYFVVRQGLRIYSIILLGLYFSDTDKEDWRELVLPKLEKFSSYKP